MYTRPLFGATLCAALSVLACAPKVQAIQVTDPLDPSAPLARLPAPRLSSSYQPLPGLDPLPWSGLFDETGRFVLDPARPDLVQAQEPGVMGTVPGGATQSPQAGHEVGAARADAIATVLGIDRDTGRVRLKHGPIESIGMPAMTMLFRVADPALLDAVAVGETVGIRVEQRDQAFYVTAWVKEARP